MVIDEKLWELIHEYKLVEIQSRVHMSNSHIDKFIDCLDMMSKIIDDIKKHQEELNRKIILFIN